MAFPNETTQQPLLKESLYGQHSGQADIYLWLQMPVGDNFEYYYLGKC
jgi:hypothetical protein